MSNIFCIFAPKLLYNTMKTIQETIINLLLEQNYIDSAEQIKAVDDWHYEMLGELRLWLKHEREMAAMFDAALEKEGYNIRTTVKLAPKDDNWFCIDLSEHENPPYFMLVSFDTHYDDYDKDIMVSRTKDDFYRIIIDRILSLEQSAEARVGRIRELLEEDQVEDIFSTNYTIEELRPLQLLHDGYVAIEDPFALEEDVPYIDLPDFDEEDDPQEAHDEFMENLEAEGKNLYCLNVK